MSGSFPLDLLKTNFVTLCGITESHPCVHLPRSGYTRELHCKGILVDRKIYLQKRTIPPLHYITQAKEGTEYTCDPITHLQLP